MVQHVQHAAEGACQLGDKIDGPSGEQLQDGAGKGGGLWAALRQSDILCYQLAAGAGRSQFVSGT